MSILGLLKCCFTSTETIGLLGTGAQDSHLDFHTTPGLWTLGLILFQIYGDGRNQNFAAKENSLHSAVTCNSPGQFVQ